MALSRLSPCLLFWRLRWFDVSDQAGHSDNTGTGLALPDSIVAAIIATLQNDRGVHAETAISAAAVLTGEYVLRSSGYDFTGLEPGTIIISDIVNQLLFEADGQLTVSDVFINALFSQGIDVSKESWPENIPDEHQVIMDPLEVVARVRPQIEGLFALSTVEALERAYACAQASALLVAQTRRVLDPNIGKALALEAMLRGAKSVPLPALAANAN